MPYSPCGERPGACRAYTWSEQDLAHLKANTPLNTFSLNFLAGLVLTLLSPTSSN